MTIGALVIRSDGKRYPSVAQAAQELGVGRSILRKAIDQGQNCKGYKFSKAGPSRLLERSDGKRYNSAPEAAKDNFVAAKVIKSAIRRGGKSAGYTWRWVNVLEEQAS